MLPVRDDPYSALVTVPTFNRAEELNTFMIAMVPQLQRASASMLVIDNSLDGNALATVAGYLSDRVAYISEPSPGIAAARNAGLAVFEGSGHGSIVFIDDDEAPADNWLETLLGYSRISDAGVITGPVISELPPDAPSWIKSGGFHSRSIRRTGSTSWTAASNNTLLKRDSWERAGRPRFDDRFSFTGGSDTDFFARLADQGVVLEYCAEAIVHEVVPSSRLTRQWLNRRALRSGLVNGLVLRRKHGLLGVLALGCANIVVGAAAIAISVLRDRYPEARSWNRYRYGLGMVGVQFGWRVHEYKRGATG